VNPLADVKEKAFDEHRKQLNVEALRAGVFQATLAQPLFVAFEWFAMRKQFLLIQFMRMLFLVPILVSGWIIFRRRDWIREHIDAVVFVMFLFCCEFVVVVSFLHTGYSSPYALALPMIMVGVGVVTLWPTRISIPFYGLSYMSYLLPLVLGVGTVENPTWFWAFQVFALTVIVYIISAQQVRLRLTRESFLNQAIIWSSDPPSHVSYASLPGKIGRYDIIRRLGVGGMAETFLAVARGPGSFEQHVCIKCLLPAYMAEPRFTKLFMNEARLTASLQHPNIVRVVDFGEDVTSKAFYLALELVDGADLRTVMRSQRDKRLPHSMVVQVGTDVALALQYAHKHVAAGADGAHSGVIHRDISPSNVMVSYAGDIKLTDFGIAKELRIDDVTHFTGIKGKLAYMSPEQLKGQRLDGRSDVFSLGIMLYECLTGFRPFDGDTDMVTVERITSGQHKPLKDNCDPATPSALIDAIESLLEPNLSKRCPSATVLLEQLQPVRPSATARSDISALIRQTLSHPPVAAGLSTHPSSTFELGSAMPSAPSDPTRTNKTPS